MNYIWIVLALLSFLLIAIYNKKVNKAMYPSQYKKPLKKPLRENRMMSGALIGLFLGVVATTVIPDNMALCISGAFFAGILLGMIFRKKSYVESVEELGYTANEYAPAEEKEAEPETVNA